MKLTDLVLTPAALAATKKLSHQVQKTLVAAGKAPRVELGVVGFDLRQKQSTGDTSRIVPGTALGGTRPTPMIRRPMMAEEMTAKSAFKLLMDVVEDLDWDKEFQGAGDFDAEEAMEEALRMVHLWKHNKATGAEMQHAYSVIANQLRSKGSIEVIAASTQELEKIGFKVTPWVQDILDTVVKVHYAGDRVYHHFRAAERIAGLIEAMSQLKPDHRSYPFVQAALKKLGVQ